MHLELHTPNPARACLFYTGLLAWRPQTIHSTAGTYLTLEMGGGFDAGLVEAETRRAFWLPYVEVEEVGAVTEEAARLGADVLLGVREGPAGWRAVVASDESGPLAFWQPKR